MVFFLILRYIVAINYTPLYSLQSFFAFFYHVEQGVHPGADANVLRDMDQPQVIPQQASSPDREADDSKEVELYQVHQLSDTDPGSCCRIVVINFAASSSLLTIPLFYCAEEDVKPEDYTYWQQDVDGQQVMRRRALSPQQIGNFSFFVEPNARSNSIPLFLFQTLLAIFVL